MILTRVPLRTAARAAATSQHFSSTFVIRAASTCRVAFPSFSRTYATPAKPKKGSIGETAKRGRATKTSSTTAKSKPKSTKSKATTKSESAPARRKSSRSADRKLAAKEKAEKQKELKAARVAKKKEQAAKKKEKAALAREKKKADKPAAKVRLLKSKALLDAPKASRLSAWSVFLGGYARNRQGQNITQIVQNARGEYTRLSDSEKESYARRAEEELKGKKRELLAWVEKHSPSEIKEANLARKSLKRLGALRSKSLTPISDPRAVKKPSTPYFRFYQERYQTDRVLQDQAKEIGRLWRDLSSADKQRYIDAYARDLKEYTAKCEQVYGKAA